MAINVNVRYNGGFLPDIIRAMKRFCICSLLIPPKGFGIFSPITGGCSEDLGVFWFSLKQQLLTLYWRTL